VFSVTAVYACVNIRASANRSPSASRAASISCEIERELHKGRFDVTTGKATRRPTKRPVAAYECTAQDDAVYVQGLRASATEEGRTS
jgi:nitrite reductase/ring-hydroxylating ferredoxin subunit